MRQFAVLGFARFPESFFFSTGGGEGEAAKSNPGSGYYSSSIISNPTGEQMHTWGTYEYVCFVLFLSGGVHFSSWSAFGKDVERRHLLQRLTDGSCWKKYFTLTDAKLLGFSVERSVTALRPLDPRRQFSISLP